MSNRGVKRFASAPLEYLTREQMQDIHAASLEVLEDCGTVVHCEEAVELLERASVRVKDGKHVFIPGNLVEEAIRSAPSSVTIYDRNENPAMLLESTNAYYGTGSDCPNLLDSFTGERRAFLSKDVEDSIRLVDALPNIDFVMCNGLAADIHPEAQYQYKYALMIRHSIKPQVIVAGDKKSLTDIRDIAACVRGGRDRLSQKPIFVLYDEPTSPLVYTREAMEKLLFMAENRLPINYSPGMMAGASGPITLAGVITLANAEILAGLVIHQLKNPGSPC